MKNITYTIALLLALTPLSAMADTFNDVIVGGSAHLDESLVHILETKTDTEDARRILQGNVLTLTPGSESQTDFRNLLIHTDVDNANVRKVSGFTSDVYHNSGGTLTDGFGTVNQVWSWGAGDITTARGALNAVHNKGTGNFFSAYGASNYVGNYSPTGVGITAGYGAYNHIGNESTGEITTAYGALNEVLNSSAGTIGTAYGASYYIGNASSTGTITTAKSLSVGLHNAGSVQDWYGLHVTPISGTVPAGNRYGVYVEDVGDNYFAGNVGVGNSSPTAKLNVDAGGAGDVLRLERSDTGRYLGINFSGNNLNFDSSQIGSLNWTLGPNGIALLSSTFTDNTNKQVRLGVPSYDSDEEPFLLGLMNATAANNTLSLGGGTALGNAATRIVGYTGALNTQLGTVRFFVDSTGEFGIGQDQDPDFQLEVAGMLGSGYLGVSSGIDTDGDIFIINSSGDVGIGTTNPSGNLHVSSPGKNVIIWDSESVSEGACIKIKDSDGGGYTYMTTLNGTANFSTTSCE